MIAIMRISLACACAFLAKWQGRNTPLWFILGLLFPVIALILLFLLPLPIKGGRKKTPLFNQRPQTTNQTEKKGQKTGGVVIDITPPDPFKEVKTDIASTCWYYLEKGHEQRGPMSFEAFKRAWKEGRITPTTYVWNESLTEWKLFSEL